MRIEAIMLASVLLVPGGLGRAEEVYRSTGPGGTPVYGNVPMPGAASTGIRSRAERVPPPEADAAEGPAAAQVSPASARELAGIEERLRTIEEEMAELARARTAHAAGGPATGGIGTNAADVLSPEEEALAAERDRLTKRIAELTGRDAD